MPAETITPDITIQSARVTRVDTRFNHAVHAYHGIDAWSRDGSKLLYAGIDEPGRAVIVVRYMDTAEEVVLAENAPCNFHTAARQRWVFNDTAVCYGAQDDYDEHAPTIVCLDKPNQAFALEGLRGYGIRAICRDGVHASAAMAGDSPAVARVNLQDQSIQTLATAEECVRQLPSELSQSNAKYSFTHPVYSPDESRLFFKLMCMPAGEAIRFCAFFVLHLEPRRLLCLGDRISGHPYWLNDNRHIINVKSPRDGSDNRWLVLVDSETGTDRRVVDLPIEGPGHPSQSPCGRFISTDAFTPDGQACPIYLIDLQTGVAHEIARLDHKFEGGTDQTAFNRGQPHPVWSPCGKKLLVNCNQGGTQYRLFVLEEFLT